MHVLAPLGSHARRLGLEEGDPLGAVEVGGHRPRRPRRAKGAGEPRLVVEAYPNEEHGAPQRRHLSRLDVDGVRVLPGSHQRFHGHPVPGHRLYERLEIRGRGHDSQRAAAPRGSGSPEKEGDGALERPEHAGYFLAVKIDFGIMQCTPLRTSTTWLTRQSATMEVSE